MSATPSRRWQVLLSVPADAPLVAGLPCAVRAAYRAGKELGPERIVIAGADQDFLRRWSFPLRAAGGAVLGDKTGFSALDPRLPLLVLDAESFPDQNALAAFAAEADRRPGDLRRAERGRAWAALRRDASALGAGSRPLDRIHAEALSATAPETDAGDFLDARGLAAGAAAEVLYSRLAKDNDGYIAKFDRVLSISLTRLMLPFPITPNQVTTVSLVFGLLGAWWLAAPSREQQFAGALVLWLCALLDGCDGEIARLKHHITPHGGDFDLWADHLAHLATFVALPIGVARLNPGTDWRLPGVLLVTGFLACGFAVWKLVLSVPEEKRGRLTLIVERLASRDYVYLIVALTAIGRLDLFVWTAAIGSHAFWAGLWWLSRRR